MIALTKNATIIWKINPIASRLGRQAKYGMPIDHLMEEREVWSFKVMII